DGRDNDGDGLSDGSDPDCVGVTDHATHPDSNYGVCNTDREVGDDVYVDYEGICPAYNQPEQILQRVFELRALADLYSVGALTLHTVLLFAPQADVEAVCPGASAAFGYNGGQARALLQQMAQAGGGSFRDVNIATTGHFFDFDFVTLESREWLTDLVAANANARRAVAGFGLGATGVLADSDGDGVPDEVERALSTSVTSPESDGGDHYGDLLELRERDAGFDARDPALPAAPCADASDLDGDGLSDCEEAWLGTGMRDPDTDNDGIIDWLEVVAGTDPLVDDGARDLDFDGVSNRDELRGGSNPLAADAATYRDERVLYGLTDVGDVAVDDGTGKTTVRHCYDFDVSRVPLAPTELGADRGRNRVMIYAHERPLALAGTESRVSVVCAEVRYEGPTAKVPADGRVDWSEAAWARDHEELLAKRDALVACRPGGHVPADVRRSDLDDLVHDCLDDKAALGDRLYRGAELTDLLAGALDNRLRPRWAATPSALWKPIESFDADRDCVRPEEPQLVFALLDRLRACLACPEPPGNTAVTP
ncbi:MAG: hypothetical protein KC635_03395, partial [Myxococcales bacterium]|nr:hypothetical protein [Myxococcales bacterium]